MLAIGEAHARARHARSPASTSTKRSRPAPRPLIGFGGHAAAAGLKVAEEHLADFASLFEERCRNALTPEQLRSIPATSMPKCPSGPESPRRGRDREARAVRDRQPEAAPAGQQAPGDRRAEGRRRTEEASPAETEARRRTYIPLYVQGVLGGKATKAGEVLTPLFFAWALSVAVAAKVVIRFGFRTTAVVGMGMITLGMAGLAIGASMPDSAVLLFKASLVVTGLGFGPASLSCILGVQNAVDWNRRGAATVAVTFSGSLAGRSASASWGRRSASSSPIGWPGPAQAGLTWSPRIPPETHALLSAQQLRLVQDALGRSLRDVFLQMLVLSIVAIFCVARLEPGRAVSRSEPASKPEDNLGAGDDGLDRGDVLSVTSEVG